MPLVAAQAQPGARQKRFGQHPRHVTAFELNAPLFGSFGEALLIEGAKGQTLFDTGIIGLRDCALAVERFTPSRAAISAWV